MTHPQQARASHRIVQARRRAQGALLIAGEVAPPELARLLQLLSSPVGARR